MTREERAAFKASPPKLALRPDVANTVDTYAVEVCAQDGGGVPRRVGFVPRPANKLLASLVVLGDVFTATAAVEEAVPSFHLFVRRP